MALACSIRTLRGRWFHIRCRCGHSTAHPVRLMLREDPAAGGQTAADMLVNLRCSACQGRRLTVHLTEQAHGPGSAPRSAHPIGWALLLHDSAGPESAQAAE